MVFSRVAIAQRSIWWCDGGPRKANFLFWGTSLSLQLYIRAPIKGHVHLIASFLCTSRISSRRQQQSSWWRIDPPPPDSLPSSYVTTFYLSILIVTQDECPVLPPACSEPSVPVCTFFCTTTRTRKNNRQLTRSRRKKKMKATTTPLFAVVVVRWESSVARRRKEMEGNDSIVRSPSPSDSSFSSTLSLNLNCYPADQTIDLRKMCLTLSSLTENNRWGTFFSLLLLLLLLFNWALCIRLCVWMAASLSIRMRADALQLAEAFTNQAEEMRRHKSKLLLLWLLLATFKFESMLMFPSLLTASAMIPNLKKLTREWRELVDSSSSIWTFSAHN